MLQYTRYRPMLLHRNVVGCHEPAYTFLWVSEERKRLFAVGRRKKNNHFLYRIAVKFAEKGGSVVGREFVDQFGKLRTIQLFHDPLLGREIQDTENVDRAVYAKRGDKRISIFGKFIDQAFNFGNVQIV